MSRRDSSAPPPLPPGYGRPKSRRWPWLLVAGLFVASIGLGIVGVTRAKPAIEKLARDPDGLDRMLPRPLVFPGTRTVHLSDVGEYRVYHEYESEVDGRTLDSPRSDGFDLSLRSAKTGEEVSLSSTGPLATERYDLPHRRAIAIREFRVKTPGDYVLTARHADDAGGDFVLSVGKPVLEALLGGAAPGFQLIGFAVLCFVVALVLMIVLLVRRKPRW